MKIGARMGGRDRRNAISHRTTVPGALGSHCAKTSDGGVYIAPYLWGRGAPLGGNMRLRFCEITILALFVATACPLRIFAKDPISAKNPASQSDWLKQTPETLKVGIEQNHPAAFYILASKLFGDGKKDEAVFWFYAGQLRYRFYLKANPGLNPSGDPALFASLSETVGRPVNEYAFGDI